MIPKRSIPANTPFFLKTSLILLIVLVLAATLQAATVDPLLRGFAQRELGGEKSQFGISYEQLIAIEPGATSAETRIGVILFLDGSLPDLARVPGLVVGSVSGDIATARLPLTSLELLSRT
ncbi:MAG: hypothetical protein ABIF77_10420, partial [bacterium]